MLTQQVQYNYDTFDNLIRRRVDTNGDGSFDEEQSFVLDLGGKGGLDDVVLAFDETGNVEHRYLHGPAVDELFADESAVDGLLWALADRQGTVRDWAQRDPGTGTTSVYNHVEFDAYGKIISQTNASHEITAGGYTGRYHDPLTGLRYHRARWTDPNTGWISEDPIGFAGGDVNLSRYVGNGVGNYVDPSGLDDEAAIIEYMREAGYSTAEIERTLIARSGGGDGGNLLGHDFRPPDSPTRGLTPGEREMLRSLFGEHLNTDGLCLGKVALFPGVRENSMTPRYTPWFPLANYSDDFSKEGLRLRYHFVHEMTHVLQSQNGNWNWIDGPYYGAVNLGDYGPTYRYSRADLGKPLWFFNFEQQARIVADFYAGSFSGEELERRKKTINGFDTQAPWIQYGDTRWSVPGYPPDWTPSGPGGPGGYNGGFPQY